MNEIVIMSYVRSIQRGTRTIDQVPAEIRDAVEAKLNA